MYDIIIKIQYKKFKEDEDKLNKLSVKIVRNLSQRLFTRVVKNTPVGDYKIIRYANGKTYNEGKVGGTLRRCWRISPVTRNKNYAEASVYNVMNYADYVESGHRQTPGRFVPYIGKKLKKPWVKGRFMLKQAYKQTEKEIDEVIREVLADV